MPFFTRQSIGNRDADDHRAKRFLEAAAAMTAKCIMRDELVEVCGMSEGKAGDIVATIIARLNAYGYTIEQETD